LKEKVNSYPVLGFAALCLLALCLGCVQRRMTIRSNPPGALVYIDDYEIGTTPVSTDFVYYGTRKFRLVKDGFETITELRPISPPWYQYVPLDFVAENIAPWEIRDERLLDFQLRPQLIVPTEQLLGRADDLRNRIRPGAIALPGTPAAAPPGALPSQGQFQAPGSGVGLGEGAMPGSVPGAGPYTPPGAGFDWSPSAPAGTAPGTYPGAPSEARPDPSSVPGATPGRGYQTEPPGGWQGPNAPGNTSPPTGSPAQGAPAQGASWQGVPTTSYGAAARGASPLLGGSTPLPGAESILRLPNVPANNPRAPTSSLLRGTSNVIGPPRGAQTTPAARQPPAEGPLLTAPPLSSSHHRQTAPPSLPR
jgi:PEGA domain